MKNQRDAALLGPQVKVKIARHDLAALVDADRRRESHFLPGAFRDRPDVAAPEGEPGLQGEKQHDPGNFFPVRALGLRTEEPPIRQQVLFVVGSQHQLISAPRARHLGLTPALSCKLTRRVRYLLRNLRQ